MKTFNSVLIATVMTGLLAGCGDQHSSNPAPGTNATAAAGNSPADYLGTLVQAKKTADKTIDVSYLMPERQFRLAAR
jgi:hypothetical protein